MKKTVLFCHFIFIVSYFSFSQNVGIGTATPSGKLHVKGTANVSQLIIDANSTQGNTNPLIKLRNNSGSDLMWIHSDDINNTFIGLNTGRVNNAAAGGTSNTFIGKDAGYSNTTGYFNTANGWSALYSNISGYWNVASGAYALYSNTTGYFNAANGMNALRSNTTGYSNTANGFQALTSNTTGYSNTATGSSALVSNTSGIENTATGYQALISNTVGSDNTATGSFALYYNTSVDNTATGSYALLFNTTGNANTASGSNALRNNNTGSGNTAIGADALSTITTGSNNTAIGISTHTSAGTFSNTTTIGAGATVNINDKVRLGGSDVISVEGQVSYSTPSDGRFKENIKDDVKGLDFIMKLQPVSYNFNRLKYALHVKEYITPDKERKLVEQSQIRTVGFVAQDVEKIIRQTGFTSFDAVHAPTNETDNYSMGYAEFVVPLVKAVQELSGQNTELKNQTEELQKIVSDQKKLNEDLLQRIQRLESSLSQTNKLR